MLPLGYGLFSIISAVSYWTTETLACLNAGHLV